jgi:hypothetical protein
MDNKEPQIRPITWPPITLLGLAVLLLGMVNIIKAVDPKDAIITTCSIDSTMNTIATTRVASKLWII